ERGPRGRIRAARAQAPARRAARKRGPPSGRPGRLDGGVTRRLVIDLASPRLAWRAPASVVQAIRQALGGGWEVVEVRAPAASDGDGGSGSAEAVDAVRGAEIYFGYGVPAGVVEAARATLRWAHSGSAGVAASLPHLKGTSVVLTNSAVLHAEPSADWVIAAPHTVETRGAVNRATLDRLPADAVVVNASRGTLLDEAALLDLLDRGRLRGAALDVFSVEPLPSGHPFWRHPRVLVSPHVAAVTGRFWEREAGLMVQNIRRYLAGAPLLNVVDQEAGY